MVLTVALLLVSLGTGCTKYAKEEDLQNLEHQKQAALSAEKKVDQMKSEKAALEKTKAQKQDELQKAQAEHATVTERQKMMQGDQGMMQGEGQMMKGGDTMMKGGDTMKKGDGTMMKGDNTMKKEGGK